MKRLHTPLPLRRQLLAGLASAMGTAVAGAALGLRVAPARANTLNTPDTVTPRPWPANKPTPALQLPQWEGQPWSLAAQRGKPVLLNFWASWCEPCRAELPSLELLATRHEAQGLQVMCVNFRETDGALRRFMDSSALSLPVLRDSDGAAAQAFGVRTFPSTVAINRQGRVLGTVVGEVDWGSPAARRWVALLL